MRKIAVIGSRTFDDYDRLEGVLLPWLPATIISGGAKGLTLSRNVSPVITGNRLL